MENTKENISDKKRGGWKQTLGLILNLALLLLIDGLVIYTFSSTENGISRENINKILLIVIGNILFLALLFWGDRLCNAIKETAFLKAGDILLLVLTPGIVLMLVQMVTWLSGYRNKATATFLRLVKSSLTLKTSDLLLNLSIYTVIFILLIIICRKVNIATSALCYLLVVLAMVNYYVMEFRGEPFLLLDIVGMGTAAEVVGEYNFTIKLMLGIPLIYALVFAEFALKFQKLELGKRSRRNTIFRFAALAVLVVALGFSLNPVLAKVGEVKLWKINRIYKEEGYVSSLFREIPYFNVEQPEGYSIEKVEELAQNIEKTIQLYLQLLLILL